MNKLTHIMPLLLDTISDGVFVLDVQSNVFRVVEANRIVGKYLGLMEHPQGMRLQDLMEDDVCRWLRFHLLRVTRFKEPITVHEPTRFNNGGDMTMKLSPILEGDDVTSIIGTVSIQEKSTYMCPKRERYVEALEYAPYGVCFIHDDLTPFMINRTLCKWMSKPLNHMMQQCVSCMIVEEDRSIVKQALQKVAKGKYTYKGIEVRLNSRSKQETWVSMHVSRTRDRLEGKYYTVIQLSDITERKRNENELMRLATEDHLTRLSNRRVFEESLKKSVKNARRYNRCGAVVYIDLDDFKNINDTFGHKAGDTALIEVGHVLKNIFRETDAICRIGGDEFAIIMNEVDPEEAQSKAHLTQETINTLSFETHGKQVSVRASVGVQVFDGDDDMSLDEILEAADKSMYARKASSRNEIRQLRRFDA